MSQPLVPALPDNAPFTAEQRAWLNGFLAGIFSRVAAPAAAPVLEPLTILFGSQTGTAESLAKRAVKEAGKRGFAARAVDMSAVNASQLALEKNVLVITSTYGEGEPPDNARSLHAALTAGDAPRLGGVRFSVCSLGDTNYAKFCQCGKDFDLRMEQLGAVRALPRADCDLDLEAPFTTWLAAAFNALSSTPASATTAAAPAAEVAAAPASGHSRQNPFPALLRTSRNLNGEGSAKQVHHIEFSLENSGLVYEPGDALGVAPHNCPELVDDMLAILHLDGKHKVTVAGTRKTFRHALTENFDLGKPSEDLLKFLQLPLPKPATDPDAAKSPQFHQVIDALLASEKKPSAEELTQYLRKLQPRLYSISSSPRAHPGEVHLTVGALRYDVAGRGRKGVCSTFLSDRVMPEETQVGVFVHHNRAFRLPADGSTPVIMVGPGTGIAPFRAFLEERRAAGAPGKNWLFFGDQSASTDFLYRDEILAWQSDGHLSRLDLAWSRDQAVKIYVQHRMLENAAELFAWLETGAHFYVCGDAGRMAKDVDAALHQVVERGGGRTPEKAAAYVQALRAAKRYVRDVY
jgi:sulfite reductase (NADPH) flavoprotein alpha-component